LAPLSPKDLGITGFSPRTAFTGDLLLEVSGVGNEAKADASASGMRDAVVGTEGVISRLTKSLELRLRGLDFSDVVSAVAD